MSKAVQRRRGTTAQHQNFTGEPGEITVDTDKNTLRVHDGVTPGGHPLAKEGEGGAIESTWLYPNGGTEENPANITPNSRYVMDSPWPGFKVKCMAQLLFSGHWGDMANFTSHNGSLGHGTFAAQLENNIIVQTGLSALAAGSYLQGNPFGDLHGINPTTAPCRVYCEKGGPLP